MLGKQEMHLHEDFLDVLKESELIADKSQFGEKELEDSVLFFKALGFKEVHALDVSNYERADIIFNLNDDLPEDLMCKFDVIFDGGVIEHVFDVGKAFTSICKMTAVGGIIISCNPVYNYIHNTFWNISPEMFLDFYSVNNYSILDCSIFTWLAEDIERREWPERPIIWSPDVRCMNYIHPLYAGQHLRSLNKLCTNPHPHTYIVARKTHNEELIYPIVSGYARKHRGEKEETGRRTSKRRTKYDMSKIVKFIESKDKIALYGANDICKAIMKALYENNLEDRVLKVFEFDTDKIGMDIMGKSVCYLNNNTISDDEEILICNENADETYQLLCKKGIASERVYRLMDVQFLKEIEK